MEQELYWLHLIQEELSRLTLAEPTAIAEHEAATHHLALAANHLERLGTFLNPPSAPTEADGLDDDELPF